MVGARALRVRHDDDLPSLVRVLRAVHERDGYPGHWPEDPQAWLTPADLVGAWVVYDGRRPLGHVALSAVDPRRPTAAAWATAAGGDDALLRCVTRLFVAATARRTGAGTALLDAAVEYAQQAGARTVLEVASSDADAVALYRRRDWVEAGPGDSSSGGDRGSLLFVAPDSSGRRPTSA